MSPVIIIQARMSSTRFPGKVLAELAGKPMLQHVIERCQQSSVKDVYVAIANEPESEILKTWCDEYPVIWYAGDVHNLLKRYCDFPYAGDPIIRVCSDCPLINPMHIDALVMTWEKCKSDYVAYEVYGLSGPRPAIQTKIGMPELITRNGLEELARHAEAMQEHATLGAYQYPRLTRTWIPCLIDTLEDNAVDTPEDLHRIAELCKCDLAAAQ